MIHEFAVEPEILANLAHAQRLTEAFGFDRGRFLAQVPDRLEWQARVAKATETAQGEGRLQPVKRKSIVEKHAPHIAGTMRGASRSYSPDADWVENAIHAHQVDPLRLIIAARTKDGTPSVRCLDDIDPNDELWKTEQTQCVGKTASTLANLVSPLLRVSQEVYIVDPYLSSTKRNGSESNYIPTLNAICRDVETRPPVKVFEVHVRSKRLKHDGMTDEEFECKCKQLLPKTLPKDQRVRVCIWSTKTGSDRLHDRFCLTNVWGIQVSSGFEQWGDNQFATLTLLSPNEYRKRYDQFARRNGFKLVREFEV